MKELMDRNRILQDRTTGYRGTLFEVRMLAFVWLVFWRVLGKQDGLQWWPTSAGEILEVRRNPQHRHRADFIDAYNRVVRVAAHYVRAPQP